MKRLAFWFAAAAFFAMPSLADYRFQVPRNHSIVTVNPDASIEIRYAITFDNQGQPIDIIDVGLPDGQYSLSDVTADLDGSPLGDIRKSTYIAHGVEVHLGGRAIPAGSRGTLNLRAVARNRVFYDDKDETYASVVFSPTWYGSDFTSGTTNLACEFVLPEGVEPDEPRYHRNPFTSARMENGRVVYRWEIPDASPSRQYTFGASFPARVMDRVIEGPGPLARFLGALVSFVMGLIPCFLFVGIGGIIAFAIVKSVKRRQKYLPPSVGMEGVEVRRGLTVPEVAVLMEQKADKVLAMILFGMVRKEALRVTGRKPLRLEILREEAADFSYEREFLKAVKDDGMIDEKEASRILIDLIKRVKTKMKGFSRRKSLLYYKDIMRRAWVEAGTEDYDQAFEWLLLDKEFDEHAQKRYGTQRMPVPTWWPSMYTGRVGGGGGAASTGGSVGGAAAPGMKASAQSIVSGIQGFGQDLVSSVPGLASKVTSKTNPVPVSSGRGYSGGSGCACACACAGCACACAGGGR